MRGLAYGLANGWGEQKPTRFLFSRAVGDPGWTLALLDLSCEDQLCNLLIVGGSDLFTMRPQRLVIVGLGSYGRAERIAGAWFSGRSQRSP